MLCNFYFLKSYARAKFYPLVISDKKVWSEHQINWDDIWWGLYESASMRLGFQGEMSMELLSACTNIDDSVGHAQWALADGTAAPRGNAITVVRDEHRKYKRAGEVPRNLAVRVRATKGICLLPARRRLREEENALCLSRSVFLLLAFCQIICARCLSKLLGGWQRFDLQPVECFWTAFCTLSGRGIGRFIAFCCFHSLCGTHVKMFHSAQISFVDAAITKSSQ